MIFKVMMFVSIKQGKYLNLNSALVYSQRRPIIWEWKFHLIQILKRLNVEQTLFGESIEFKMRTFRFTSEGTSSLDPQQQTIECDLHLEPSANIVQEQAADCSCHTQEDCQGRSQNSSHIHLILKNQNLLTLSIWELWLLEMLNLLKPHFQQEKDFWWLAKMAFIKMLLMHVINLAEKFFWLSRIKRIERPPISSLRIEIFLEAKKLFGFGREIHRLQKRRLDQNGLIHLTIKLFHTIILFNMNTNPLRFSVSFMS